MTENTSPCLDYLIEQRLKNLNPKLHGLYKNSVFAMDRLLINYKNIFPFFTNHTFEHSAQVVNYCNLLAQDYNVDLLNEDELYVLIMGACLHDVGMGISKSDFLEFSEKLESVIDFTKKHQDANYQEITRLFHQEFGALFLEKYKDLFEISSPIHLLAISQIIRGHRKQDLLSEEYKTIYTDNGNPIRLSYLTALVKMADELDITSDRNLLFDYKHNKKEWSPYQTLCYKCHEALKRFVIEDNALVLYFFTDEEIVFHEIMDMQDKVNETFREYKKVIENQNEFKIMQNSVVFRKIKFGV